MATAAASATAGSLGICNANAVPRSLGSTTQVPPCAFATACTIERPRPDSAARPRARVVGAGETVEDAVERLGWDAAPAVDDLDHEIAAEPPARSSIVSCGSVYFTAFSSSASSAARSASSSASIQPGSDRAEDPAARRNLGPAHEDVLDERLDVDLRDREEPRLACFREQ